ncbi:MAG: sulfatase-like hydrolase/transferase, partial [Sulfurimonas sp.]|nr:sulfatase-like hydrolase/transferase [Sulfurimonas sp.]
DFTGTMEKVFGLKGTPSNKQTLGINANKNLNYPINPIKISNPKPTNIFIFALDATRASIISKDVSPNIFELSQTSSVYSNHVSGGNATRFGIFSLFYGLNAPYWFVFLNAQKGSILFNTLNDLHYQTHIFSSTSTAWPEFTKTVYFDIQDKVSDKYEGKPYQKDIQSSDDFTKWIDSVDRDKPIFSFVFLDAPHGSSYPESTGKYKPDDNTGISYLTVNEDDRQILFNRYKNAVNFDDTLVKKMIDKLKEKGLYDNSMIIITADHGQEFYEYGGYGHNSSFNSEQIKVPFIMHLPENKHKVINRLTSHLDVVPTLMSYIGVENDTNDYSNGYSLFDKNYNRKQAYIGNWNNSAVLTEKYTYVFSNLPNKIFENKTYKTDSYELVKDKDTNRQKVTLKVLNENSRFIK